MMRPHHNCRMAVLPPAIFVSVGHVRNERDLPRPLERDLQLALVHRAGARDPARQNLAALRDERPEQLHVLVVDVVDLVRAELADFSTPEQRPPLPLLPIAALLVAAAAATAPATSLSEWHLGLHPVKSVIIGIFGLRGRPPFAWLSLRRQSALDAPAFRFGLPLRAGALDHLLLL